MTTLWECDDCGRTVNAVVNDAQCPDGGTRRGDPA